MKFKKDELLNLIYNKVKKIRNNLNLVDVEFEILDLEIIQDEDVYLMIYTLTRSDKSTIIGPGGWVVGKLREELKELFGGNLIIKVEDYADKLILEEKKTKAISLLNKIGLKKGEKIAVLVQCMYDLSVLDFLKKYFDVQAVSFDIGTIVLPSKNKYAIEDYLIKNNIPYKFIKPIELGKEDISKALRMQDYPCNEVCNELNKYIIKECKNIKYIINNHIHKDIEKNEEFNAYILNFLKIYPFKKNNLRENYLSCPLMIQACKKNNNIKLKLMDEIVSNVYEGLLEPTEGSEMIVKINNL